MDSQIAEWQIAVPLRKFLTITECPPRWKGYDLYLFRDERVAFYAGQSFCAWERVWDHLKGGPHGHSIIGRFILCNWPASGRFTLELFSSQGPRFAGVGHSLDAAERLLIETYTPCFNVALNAEPLPLPAGYLPPNASIKYLKNFRRMLREAEIAEKRIRPEDMEWN